MVVPPSKLTFQWKNGPFEDIFSTKRKGTFHCLFLFADFDTFSQGSFFFLMIFLFPRGGDVIVPRRVKFFALFLALGMEKKTHDFKAPGIPSSVPTFLGRGSSRAFPMWQEQLRELRDLQE